MSAWTPVGLVWRKELLDTLRDRRTLMAMVVVPLLLYPILIIGISQLGMRQAEKLRDVEARLIIMPAGAAPTLEAAFAADTSFTLGSAPADPRAALESRDLDAILEVPSDFEERLSRGDSLELTVVVDLSRDQGQETRDRTQDFLLDWRHELILERLEERGLPSTLIRPFGLNIENAAGARKMSGSLLGRVLPALLVVMMMSGALYPAIDVTAGERERGTLETLLVSPVNRFTVVLGKYLTVFVVSMVTTLANLLSMGFTVFYLIGSAKMGGAMGSQFPQLFDAKAFLLILVVMVPMALFFCGLAMLVSSFARSFKEAQNYLSPLLIACMVPAYITLLPGIDLSYELALIPVANVVLLCRELLLGNYPWDYLVLTVATMSGFALLLLSLTVSMFGGEAMLGGSQGGRRISLSALTGGGQRTESLTAGLVGPVFALVLLGFFYLGSPLQIWNIKAGLAITQVFVLAGIPLLALRLLRIPVVETLRMGKPVFLTLVLALALAPAGTLLAAVSASLQGIILEVPDSYRELMEKLILVEEGSGVWLALFVFAVLPGLCEEILFRGFVLRGFLTRYSPAASIVATAVLFGVFHFDMYRLLPTMVLGVVLGWVAWRTGRLWPSVVIHIANNALAVLASGLPALKKVSWLQEGGDVPVEVIVPVAVVGVAAALGIHRLGSRGVESSAKAVTPASPMESGGV